jgi:outer membrane protein assembly factor BamB
LVAGDRVLVRSGSELLTVALGSGAVLNRRQAPPLDLLNGVLADGCIVSAFDSRLEAWDPDGTRPRWSRAHHFTPVPLAASGGLLVAAEGDTIHGLALASGERRWSHPVRQEEPGIGALFFGTDQTVVVAASGAVLGLDASSGELRWRSPAPFPATGILAVTDEGEIHLLRWDRYLRLSAVDGSTLLERDLDPGSLPRIRTTFGRLNADRAHVVACDARGPMIAVSRNSGAVVWALEDMRHRRLSDLPVVEGARLHVLDAEGTLDCFESQ